LDEVVRERLKIGSPNMLRIVRGRGLPDLSGRRRVLSKRKESGM
jgi:hypothetical protein